MPVLVRRVVFYKDIFSVRRKKQQHVTEVIAWVKQYHLTGIGADVPPVGVDSDNGSRLCFSLLFAVQNKSKTKLCCSYVLDVKTFQHRNHLKLGLEYGLVVCARHKTVKSCRVNSLDWLSLV